MGGAIASLFAARYPETTLSIWLLAPGGVESAQPSEREQLIDKGVNILVPRNLEEFDRGYDMAFVNPPFIPNFLKKYWAKRMLADRELLEKIYQDVISNPIPTESALTNLPTPTLILWGDQDRHLHVSGAAILESIMPNAKKIIMKNIGHAPMIENPELTARYYLEFQGLN